MIFNDFNHYAKIKLIKSFICGRVGDKIKINSYIKFFTVKKDSEEKYEITIEYDSGVKDIIKMDIK